MIININMKQIGKKRQHIRPVPLEYKNSIKTIKDLIAETVSILLKQYQKKTDASQSGESLIPDAIYSEEELDALAEIGRISFGMMYNGKLPEEQNAIQTALQAFEDGLIRIFLNDEEIGEDTIAIRDIDLENPRLRQTESINLREGDTITFIRMTFLAGRMY